MRLSTLSIAIAALAGSIVSANAMPPVRAGILQCEGGQNVGYVVGSMTSLECVFQSDGRRPEPYIATVRRLGLDLGITDQTKLTWAVNSPTGRISRGELAGSYGGVGANASVGIGGGFSLVADWIPPVTLDGAKPDVATLTLERPLYESQAWRLGFRLGAGSGRVDGDFTCPRSVAAAGADPRRNPYACESASSDSERFHWKSLELGIERRLTPRVGAHVAATLWRLDGTFRAHAHWAGLDDTTRLAYVGNDWGVAGGLDWTVDPGWRLSGELFYAPLDVLRSPTDVGHSQNDPFWNLRLLVAYRLR